MPCLVCKYFQPTEPEQHKKLRESGHCESHCGREWSRYTAVQYVKNHKQDLTGWCMLNPEGRPKQSGHVCGQVDIPSYYFNANWGLERIKEDEHLFEWAQKQYTVLANGTHRDRRNAYLETDNAELRRQLQAARKISASRLKRLQKSEQPEPKPLDPLPSNIVRLVAAE